MTNPWLSLTCVVVFVVVVKGDEVANVLMFDGSAGEDAGTTPFPPPPLPPAAVATVTGTDPISDTGVVAEGGVDNDVLLLVAVLDGMTLVRTSRWGFLDDDKDGATTPAIPPVAKAWFPPDNPWTNADDDDVGTCWCV